MRVDMRDVHSLETDGNFTRVLTDMIGAAVFWEGRLCVSVSLSSRSRPSAPASRRCARLQQDEAELTPLLLARAQPSPARASLRDRHDASYIDDVGDCMSRRLTGAQARCKELLDDRSARGEARVPLRLCASESGPASNTSSFEQYEQLKRYKLL